MEGDSGGCFRTRDSFYEHLHQWLYPYRLHQSSSMMGTVRGRRLLCGLDNVLLSSTTSGVWAATLPTLLPTSLVCAGYKDSTIYSLGWSEKRDVLDLQVSIRAIRIDHGILDVNSWIIKEEFYQKAALWKQIGYINRYFGSYVSIQIIVFN